MSEYDKVIASYDEIKRKIDTHKVTENVELVAISKYHSPDKIRTLYDHGHRIFGENYLVELIEKRENLKDLKDIKWYFSGQIQSNKIRGIVENASAILSLSNIKHANKIQRELALLNKTNYPVFIAINLADEESKGVFLTRILKISKIISKNLARIYDSWGLWLSLKITKID